MLFNEIYGSYYNAVAQILSEAVNGELTDRRINEVIREKAFGESTLTIPTKLKSGDWPLLRDDLTTPIKHSPTMPLTTLQKRWLKSLLADKRIALFSPSCKGLEDVEPLYLPDTFVYYDRYSDGDDYESESYIRNFKTVLTALREKRALRVRFVGHRGIRETYMCIPEKMEYSSKDDKFRLQTSAGGRPATINIGRIRTCEVLDEYSAEEYRPTASKTRTLVLELTDERNALERVMLHFSHFEKETEQMDEIHYRITLRYDLYDETELVIRIMSFGPVLKVISPRSVYDNIRERIEKQLRLGRPAACGAPKRKVRFIGKTEKLVLTQGKTYDVLSVERGWYRIADDSGADYLYPPEMFEIV